MADSPAPQVLFEQRDGIAYITLNRPEKRNALTPEMVVRLVDLWQQVGEDPGVRVVLLTGAGDQAFSTGGDLAELIPIMMRTREPQNEWEERLAQSRRMLYQALLRGTSFFKPIVAAVRGQAYAGGFEFLLSTDIRVASPDSTFALTEVRRGLIAGGGSLARLARQVSWADAMEIALTGEPIDAEHALRIGLINRVVPSDAVIATAEELARRISLGAPIALAKSKEAIVLSSGLSLEDAFAIESRCTRENALSEDAKEGPRAFIEKREPVFRGR